jgi:hypothetical protein
MSIGSADHFILALRYRAWWRPARSRDSRGMLPYLLGPGDFRRALHGARAFATRALTRPGDAAALNPTDPCRSIVRTVFFQWPPRGDDHWRGASRRPPPRWRRREIVEIVALLVIGENLCAHHLVTDVAVSIAHLKTINALHPERIEKRQFPVIFPHHRSLIGAP